MNCWTAFLILLAVVALAADAAGGARKLTQREIVKRAMRERPDDPWPRGRGHVVLAWPGSPQKEKAYHEPGGSFSPAIGSFGISIWVLDKDGKLITTSDTIPMHEVRQELTWRSSDNPAAIHTRTPYYEALWWSGLPHTWSLEARLRGLTAKRLALVVRSVGPAGGPVRSLECVGRALHVNGTWRVTTSPQMPVHLGSERTHGWVKERTGATKWRGEDGWGYARFELANGRSAHLGIGRLGGRRPAGRPYLAAKTRPSLKLNLPDKRFSACLHAQTAHLMMGLVENWTPPGEPTNYPLAWLRDGAYTVTALARAGRLDAARELAAYFAENDFFGGFGSEADEPGLALWAMEEVACRLHALALVSKARASSLAHLARKEMGLWQDYEPVDQKLWPHARRKAELILEMLAAKKPIRKPYVGPIVPKHRGKKDLDLVCDAARDGLIVGRMDWHQPLLYVNAVSYAGLRSAARLADRLGKRDEAERWRAAAAELQKAWHRALATKEANNERTAICGLWPSWVVGTHREAYAKLLRKRWPRGDRSNIRGTPLWTYFNMAETHQWLMLGDVQRVWHNLEWFWEHQASPGLYTWWEGKGEENTFGLWENVRGWVNPPHVTPHYWTAAEMLLLQLDMLAYVDENAAEPTLVVGAGIPKAWLDKPMSAFGLHTRLGVVAWRWDRKAMHVEVEGERCTVRLGSAFAADTPVRVEVQ